MIGKVFGFLVSMAINGFFALFITVFFYIIFFLVALFAMIPVSIILGDGAANTIMNIVGDDITFKVAYTIVFISMMMDDLGVPSIKTFIKKRYQRSV